MADKSSSVHPDFIRLMEETDVLGPGEWENDVKGLETWWAVATADGIVAYTGDEKLAFFIRLALINARLNPIGDV